MDHACVIYAKNGASVDSSVLTENSKAYNILESVKLNLNIPDTLILTSECFEAYSQNHKCLPDSAIKAVREFVTASSNKLPNAYAVRCGDKNADKSLPQTIINIGITDKKNMGFSEAFIKENALLLHQQYETVKSMCCQMNSMAMNYQDVIKMSMTDQCIYIIQLMYDVFQEFAAIGKEFDRSIILQKMVFGNLDDRSLYGTAYTRHPYSGAEMDYGQYMCQKPGIVANNTPDSLWTDISELQKCMPHVYDELKQQFKKIEAYYKDVRFVEFIVESGVLYFVQLSIRNRIYMPHLFE